MPFRHCLLIKRGLIVLLQDLHDRNLARLPFQLVLALFPMGRTRELICYCFVLLFQQNFDLQSSVRFSAHKNMFCYLVDKVLLKVWAM